MKYKEYKQLSSELRHISDVQRVARERGLDNELLHVIYTQKTVRDATKRFYKVKRKGAKLLFQWRSGKSFVQIARENRFPPALTVMIILQENKIPRRKIWKLLSNPQEIKDKRLRKEIMDANKMDGVYSPNGTKRQAQRGRWGENKLRKWLDANHIQYRREAELKRDYPKTPDFLLQEPLLWNGEKKFWIESKATFGDPIEIKKHLRKQLRPYVHLFGEGLVVYWFGFVEDLRMSIPKGVSVCDGGDFA